MNFIRCDLNDIVCCMSIAVCRRRAFLIFEWLRGSVMPRGPFPVDPPPGRVQLCAKSVFSAWVIVKALTIQYLRGFHDLSIDLASLLPILGAVFIVHFDYEHARNPAEHPPEELRRCCNPPRSAPPSGAVPDSPLEPARSRPCRKPLLP